MKNEIDVVRDISGKFAQAGIPFMLTGLMAMNYYAQPRMTRDVDVVVQMNPEDAASVSRLFGEEYYLDLDAVAEACARRSMFNLIHLESVIKVDCIVRKETDYRRLEFERRREIAIHDFMTFIVSKEDLIISKLLWARDSRSELQLRDARNLLSTGYDDEYLNHWAKRLGIEQLLEECLHG